MRIAYVCADAGIPLFGNKGASNHVRDFVQALGAAGHEVTVFIARLGSSARPLGCEVREIRKPAPVDAGDPVLRSELESLARNESLRQAIAAKHQAGRFDFVYERYSLWSRAALDFASEAGVPFVLEVNSPLRLEQQRYRELRLPSEAAVIEAALFTSATLVVGVSEQVIQYVRAVSGRAGPTLVLPNGVDVELFTSVEQHRRRPDRGMTIGFLGTLKPWHGIEVLLEAFAILAPEWPGYRLLVVGDGPLRSQIEAFARAHDLAGRIELTGAVGKEQVPAYLAAMDVATAPYPALADFYFSPLKIFEYMAAGCAIVASDIGQIRDVLRDGETALLTCPGSAVDLAAAIRRLRSDPEWAGRLEANARREALEKHAWQARIRQVLGALTEAVVASRPARVEYAV